jgi:Dolichyl-phosphate-mannose-protein mannosyltransferase
MADAPSESIAPARTFVTARSLRIWIGVLLLACTLGARLPATLHYALWQDEVGVEHVIAEPTVGRAIDRLVAHESTPPTFYLMARVVDRAVSGLNLVSRARAARGLSIVFSLGCTALTLVLALELLPLWGAAVAGLLASFASILVIHGAELRAYSLFAFTCVAFALALARAVEQPVFRRLAVLAFAVALGSMSHYFFLFTFAAGVVWLLTADRTRSVLLRVGGALAVGLIPLAVWLPNWWRQFHNGHYGTAPPFSFAHFVELLPSLLVPEQVVQRTSEAIPIVASLAVLAAALVLLLRRPGTGRLCALCLLVPFIVIAVMVWITEKRVYNVRNQIGLTPFAAIVLAWGCAALPWRRVGFLAATVACALVLAGFAYSQVGLGRTPYDRIADDLIAQGFRNNEPVLWFGSYGGILPVAWYLTLDEPPITWPRVRIATPTGRACRAVEVVVRSRTGRHWLARHRDAILTQASTPSYGDLAQGGRERENVIVARLRWSRGILDRPAGAHGWFRFYRAGSQTPCLKPKP